MAERTDGSAVDGRLDGLLAGARPVFPPTPDLVDAVATAIAAEPRRRVPLWRPLALAVVALLAVAGAALAAGAIGIGPLRIVFTEQVPTPDAAVGDGLALGARVPAGEAMAGVPLRAEEVLGAPDGSYRTTNGIVTLVYGDGSLPEIDDSGVGLLLMSIPGDVGAEEIEKLVLESGSTADEVTVGGQPGYWISGAPHILRVSDPVAGEVAVRSRLVHDALVWQSGGRVMRIESALGREASIALAESLAPR